MGTVEGRASKRSGEPAGTQAEPRIAYFSMEIGIDEHIPTYSGGLGILAGDTLKSCADLGVPIAAVTLLSQKGYFYQALDDDGNQIELPVNFSPGEFLTPLQERATVTIEGRSVSIKAWRHLLTGFSGRLVPVFFLDTNLEENGEWDRTLTDFLYGGDEGYRLAQEIVLGVGGVRMLQALGFASVDRYHMNEGHAAMLTLELYRQLKDIDEVRKRCIFTTHTPVASGHDQFDLSFARPMLGDLLPEPLLGDVTHEDRLNMTKLALHFSHYVNGVAKKHGEVARQMFPGYTIDSITNGVHAPTWVSEPFRALYDRHMPGWRADPYILRSALGIRRPEIWAAHMEAKKALIDFANGRYNAGMSYEIFTIGFGRRLTEYKRPELLISDVPRLHEIAERAGAMQIVYAGKAHPKDDSGKQAIRKIMEAVRSSNESLRIAYIPNYEISIAKMMVAGVDLWLNTPRRPHEASGTSGMKAADNGVPQLSTLDGWWVEGCIEHVTGWAIGPPKTAQQPSDDDVDRTDLYGKLEKNILPMFYKDPDSWVRVMRSCIAINASFFNTHRMVQQYVVNAYFV